MEVMVPVTDFHFDSATSSPYVSAPSSPKRFGDPFDYYRHYTSTPTSPTRVAAIFAASVPFDWDERPTETQSNNGDGGDGIDEFAFDFSGQLVKGGQPPDLTAADELFEKGKLKVRPLKPPPLYNISSKDRTGIATSPRSPVSPKVKGGTGERFAPFTGAMVEATTTERGRERGQPFPYSISSSRSRKGSRSLSPMREGRGGAGGFFLKPSNSPRTSTATTTSSSTTTTPATIASECLKRGGGSRTKWRLRDLLLFRSASEGRATGNRSKDPLRKYTILASSNSSASLLSNNKRGGEDSRNSSLRSTDGGSGSMRRTTDVGSSMRRGNGPASAHEKHYMSNRMASEEMKKKTPLPYRQSFFSCLRFNPAVNSIAKGFHNSYSFDRRQN